VGFIGWGCVDTRRRRKAKDEIEERRVDKIRGQLSERLGVRKKRSGFRCSAERLKPERRPERCSSSTFVWKKKCNCSQSEFQKTFCYVEMPPKCSQLMAPLSAAAVQAAMSGACVGQGVRVTWREEEDERWTTWRGVFLCTLAFLSFTEKNVAIVFCFDDDDPGTLPRKGVEYAEVCLEEMCSDVAVRGVEVAAENAGVAVSQRSRVTHQSIRREASLMHVNRIVQDGTVQHLGDRVTTLSSQLALIHSRLEALERRPRMPDSIVKACAETPRRAVRFETDEPTTAAKRHRTEDNEAGESTPPILHEEPRPFDAEVGVGVKCGGCPTFVCCAFGSKEQRMKFLEACKGQDRCVVEWMVAHGIFPTVVKCPACNYDKLSCVLAGGTPRWQCRAEGCRKKVKSSYNVPGNWCLFLFFIVDTVCERKAIPRAHQDMVGACAKTVQQWTALLVEAATLFNADCLFACERDTRLAWGCAQWDETFHAARTFQRGQRVRVGGALTFHGGVETAADEHGKKRVIDGIIAAASSKARVDVVPMSVEIIAPGRVIDWIKSSRSLGRAR
jgi:hypothetical protein